MDIGMENGCMIAGGYHEAVTPVWKKLSFDRIKNDEDGKRHSHYKSNLQVMLFVCNNARDAVPIEELQSWISALPKSPVTEV